MNTLPLLIVVLGIFAIAYRYYSAFLAAKVAVLNDSRVTPAIRLADGSNFVPSPRWVVFGHHFAAIAGAGPLVGPTLAAQFGFAPGLVWLVAGAVLAGCVHDFIALAASLRHDGKSLPHIVKSEVGPVAGTVCMVAVLLIVNVAMAGLGSVVVNALAGSPWGIFTIAGTIPVAILMGLWMFRATPGTVQVKGPSIFGLVLLVVCIVGGHWFASSPWAHTLLFTPHQVGLLLAAYAFVAAALPVWLLLEPRDYLSTYLKLGTIAVLILGVFLVHPHLQFPAFTSYVHGRGPIIKGKLFPFLFITIACGAISGFHSLVSSGTTPKMLSKESDARMVGYGAMLAESLVGVLALIAACSLSPGDYFAINTSPEVFAHLGLHTQNLDLFSRQIGEPLAGRTGGAVSLAVGMAQIFKGIPGMGRLMSYWYHYAILFEAMFILTTIDAGTRVSRYILQELLGRVHPKLARPRSFAGNMLATGLIVAGWSYMIWGGTISTLWPIFGTGNQLLATIALGTATVYLVNHGRARYAWTTVLPMIFVGGTTLYAAVLSIQGTFWPMAHKPATASVGIVDTVLMLVFIVGVVIISLECARRCWLTLQGRPVPLTSAASPQSGQIPSASSSPAAPFRCC